MQDPQSPGLEQSRDYIETLDDLEERLSDPATSVIETMRHVPGDIIVLGIAGKMGPSLARMAKRASDAAGTLRRVIGVARFTTGTVQAALEHHGIETLR